jgi:hypothetical protein
MQSGPSRFQVFAWWLDPWLQWKANHALLDDIQRNLYFLYSQALVVKSSPFTVLPFDYASVTLAWQNVLFTITRGRGELNISVAPRSVPGEQYQLGLAVAVLEHRHFSERDSFNSLAGAATLLSPRLEALNAAFSEQEYPSIRQRL